MRKRLFTGLIITMTIFTLVGCGNKNEDVVITTNDTTTVTNETDTVVDKGEVTETPTPEPTEEAKVTEAPVVETEEPTQAPEVTEAPDKVEVTEAPDKVEVTAAPDKVEVTAAPEITKAPEETETTKEPVKETVAPTAAPVDSPVPTLAPTSTPIPTPTDTPNPLPTEKPVPTLVPTPVPTVAPTPVPTPEPTPEPTPVPTPEPVCDHELENITIKEPTCTEFGEFETVCSKCGYSWGIGKSNMTEHNFVNGVCTICHHTDETAHKHDWVLTSVTNAPTCGRIGFGGYTCTSCGKTQGMDIPPTEQHTYTLLFKGCRHEESEYQCSVCYRFYNVIDSECRDTDGDGGCDNCSSLMN